MNFDPLKELGMHAGASPQIFRNAKFLRNNMTSEELKLWDFLRTFRGKNKFRRQHPFGIFVLDFYSHRLRMSIEVDGKSHNQKEQISYDLKRTEFLSELGILEIRFTNSNINSDFNSIKNQILKVIERRSESIAPNP